MEPQQVIFTFKLPGRSLVTIVRVHNTRGAYESTLDSALIDLLSFGAVSIAQYRTVHDIPPHLLTYQGKKLDGHNASHQGSWGWACVYFDRGEAAERHLTARGF